MTRQQRLQSVPPPVLVNRRLLVNRTHAEGFHRSARTMAVERMLDAS